MRMIPALLGALLITLAVFLFMHSLIQRGPDEDMQLEVYRDVQIAHTEQEPVAPPPREQTPTAQPTTAQEPTMEPLAITAVAPNASGPVAEPATALEIPVLDLGAGDIEIAGLGDRWGSGVGGGWSAPLGAAGVDVANGGTDAQGYIEVVPNDTRRPNVPLVAWENKIDGWVLVAFSVTPQGRTREVRVLDASPRGVFEEAVIAAVSDWTYQLSFSGEVRGDVVLTQKVAVLWTNYPQNLPNVD